MEFNYFDFNRELIHEAVKKGNVEILQLLLTAKDIDVNKKAVLNRFIDLIQFQNEFI